MNIREELFALQDLKYKEFHKRLIPTIDEDTIIGVRIPALRALVKEFSATEEAAEFMKELPHPYYEENNVHAFLIEKIKGYDTCIRELDKFLPYVDNWATCDSMAPKVLKKHLKIPNYQKSKDFLTKKSKIYSNILKISKKFAKQMKKIYQKFHQ